jgi:hypothetical protein
MAKKKAKATKRPSKPAPRKKAVKKVIKKATKKATKKAIKKAALPARKPLKTKKKTAPKRKAAPTRVAPKKVVKKAAPKAKAKAVKTVARKVVKKVVKKAVKKAAPKKTAPLPVPARLQRERKRLPEAELEAFDGEGADQRLLSSARAGHDELRAEMRLHTEASPELTAGDVDAKWQDAYAVGDEAPGGDNMTPDQDRVDDIGKAMGVVYDDDEELMGGEEINERDAHRWELDPASKEDDEEL